MISSIFKILALLLMGCFSLASCTFLMCVYWSWYNNALTRTYAVVELCLSVLIAFSYAFFASEVIQDIIECEEQEERRRIAARCQRHQQIDSCLIICDWDLCEDVVGTNEKFLEEEATKGNSVVFDSEGGFRWE